MICHLHYNLNVSYFIRSDIIQTLFLYKPYHIVKIDNFLIYPVVLSHFFSSLLHYICLQDRRTVFFFFLCIVLINFKTMTRVKHGYKYQKLCHNPSPFFPWEREGSLTAKSPNLSFKNMIRLNCTYYSLLNFTSKIFQNWSFGQNSNKLSKIRSIRLYTLRITRNSHLSVNLFYIMFQAPAPAENPAEFQQITRITQIPRNPPTKSTNYVKFAHFVNLFYIMFQACPGREPSGIPANYENSAQFTHTVHELRKICTIC